MSPTSFELYFQHHMFSHHPWNPDSTILALKLIPRLSTIASYPQSTSGIAKPSILASHIFHPSNFSASIPLSHRPRSAHLSACPLSQFPPHPHNSDSSPLPSTRSKFSVLTSSPPHAATHYRIAPHTPLIDFHSTNTSNSAPVCIATQHLTMPKQPCS